MSLIVTVRDTDHQILLWGQVVNVTMSNNDEITYELCRVHVPTRINNNRRVRLLDDEGDILPEATK